MVGRAVEKGVGWQLKDGVRARFNAMPLYQA
jgi:hypothetical protein